MEFPCIICENGDPYSNIICPECEQYQDFLDEIRDGIEIIISRNNDLVGYIPLDIMDKIREEVRKIWDQLQNLKIEGKERCY